MTINLNNITKTQLRDFIDTKISNRKSEIEEEIKVTVTEKLGKSLKELLGDVSELKKVASRFEDLLTTCIHLIGSDGVPHYATTTASQSNKLCNPINYFLDELVEDALSELLNSSRYRRFKANSPLLVQTFKELNTELQPKIQLYTDGLKQLSKELNNAITNESTGKRGYNALVALGVDMSDLPVLSPNLPAVVKLSVDVCVLNGNCGELAS